MFAMMFHHSVHINDFARYSSMTTLRFVVRAFTMRLSLVRRYDLWSGQIQCWGNLWCKSSDHLDTKRARIQRKHNKLLVSLNLALDERYYSRRKRRSEKKKRRFEVVGCDRGERRYLFHAHLAETERDGCEILAWSERRDEKVD